MKKRAYWLGSLVLVLAALLLHFNALKVASKQVKMINQANQLSGEEESELLAQSRALGTKIDRMVICGRLTAGMGTLCLLAACRREEPVPLLSIVLLLGLYVLLQFAVV